jgi:hypothetical protein
MPLFAAKPAAADGGRLRRSVAKLKDARGKSERETS